MTTPKVSIRITYGFDGYTIHVDANIGWSFLQSNTNQSRGFDKKFLQLKIQG